MIVKYLSWKETDVFSFNMLSKSHLKQGQSHVEGFYDVTFTGQRMVSPSRLSPRHLTLKRRRI